MKYSEAMDYILSFTDYERDPGQSLAPASYNLDRVYRLMDEFGNPQDQFKSIHIAGTKGKGSTAATVASILSCAGYRTGLFSSPHLHSFRERMRIDGTKISEGRLAGIVERMVEHIENVHRQFPELGRLTTFEITAALGFIYFAEEEVDFAVVEVGLGGRLDATNVLRPLVSVLTPISLDHTQVLGNTIAEIAREKAGIIKPGSIVVSAPQSAEANEVFNKIAQEKNARLLIIGSDWRWSEDPNERGKSGDLTIHGLFGEYDRLRLRLIGRHQVINAVTAVAAIECLQFHNLVLTAKNIRSGLNQVHWPGRLEMISSTPRVLVDGAHNGDSMARLREALEESFQYQRLILIIGTSGDKDIAAMVQEIAPIAQQVIATQSKHPRSAPPTTVAKEVEAAGRTVSIAPDVPSALRMAREMANSDDLIVVTGSLFMVAEAREAYGITEA